MKIIPKFLQGGNIETLYSIFQSAKNENRKLAVSQNKSKKESNDDDTKGKITLKDIAKILDGVDMLPNEMLYIINDILENLQLNKLRGSNADELASIYLSSKYEINLATSNKKQYDAALSNALTNGAMAEPAISMDGKLLIQTLDGDVTRISVELLKQSPELRKNVLSVSQLANLRANDPKFKFLKDTFDIINNSIGFESFLTILKQGLSNLGTSETQSNALYGVDVTDAKNAIIKMQGLSDEEKQKLLSGSIEGTTVTRNLLLQAKVLTSYLSALLPERMKTWAAYKLNSANKTKSTEDLVFLYLLSGTSDFISTNLKYDKIFDSSSLKKSKDKDNKETDGTDDIDINTPTKFLQGRGDLEIFTINPGSSTSYLVLANTMPLTNNEGKYIGANSTLLSATQGEYLGVLDLKNVSMGGSIIDYSSFNLIILSDGKISSIDFPSRVDEHGNILPVLSKDIINKKAQADQELKKSGIDVNNPELIAQNYQKINLVYKAHGLSPNYDSEGKPTNWTRFGVMNASTDGRVLGKNFNHDLVKVIDNDFEADNLILILLENVKNYKSTRNDWFEADELYKGTIWIPLRVNYLSALANTKMKPKEGLALEEKQQSLQNLQNYNSYPQI